MSATKSISTPASTHGVSSRNTVLWCIALLATALAFVVHLAIRFQTVQLGYDVGRARKTQRDLLDQRRTLELEAAHLRHPARVEAIARERLGMDTPGSDAIVVIRRRGTASRPAGGVR